MALNRNGLKKGSKVKVDHVRKIKDIKAVSRLLQGNPRDLPAAIEASDLVPLRTSHIAGLKPGSVLNIIESKICKDDVLMNEIG